MENIFDTQVIFGIGATIIGFLGIVLNKFLARGFGEIAFVKSFGLKTKGKYEPSKFERIGTRIICGFFSALWLVGGAIILYLRLR